MFCLLCVCLYTSSCIGSMRTFHQNLEGSGDQGKPKRVIKAHFQIFPEYKEPSDSDVSDHFFNNQSWSRNTGSPVLFSIPNPCMAMLYQQADDGWGVWRQLRFVWVVPWLAWSSTDWVMWLLFFYISSKLWKMQHYRANAANVSHQASSTQLQWTPTISDRWDGILLVPFRTIQVHGSYGNHRGHLRHVYRSQTLFSSYQTPRAALDWNNGCWSEPEKQVNTKIKIINNKIHLKGSYNSFNLPLS